MTGLVKAKNEPLASSARMTAKTVAAVAAILPPKLADGMTAHAWMQTMVDEIGEHPAEVLEEARRAVLSTCAFAPTPKEFIDAVLVAYQRLKVPMSTDGARHAAYRRKPNFRHVPGDNGRLRFADDVKLLSLGFFSLAGAHANMVLDDLPLATVSDVEKAIVQLSDKPKPDKHGKLSKSISDLKDLVVPIMAYRIHGRPDQHCGGDPEPEFQTRYFAVSKATVELWRSEFKYVPVSGMIRLLWEVTLDHHRSCGVPAGYGSPEFQAFYEQAMADALPSIEALHIAQIAVGYNANWREARAAGNEEEMLTIDGKMATLSDYAACKGYVGLKLQIDKTPPLTREQLYELFRRPK